MNLKKYKKIAVLSGGISDEREISILSANAVYRSLKQKYKVEIIDVKGNCLNFVSKLQKYKPNVVFNCLHGYFGEDGQVQSILNYLKIPYTHSGVLASALAMDKRKSKDFFKSVKIDVPKEIDPTLKSQKYFPIICKPINGGSSNGIKIFKTKKELKNFIKVNTNHMNNLMFERFINGREITVGIINNKVSGVMEIKYSNTHYDYENKYINVADHIINPNLGKKILYKLKKVSLKAHKALGCNCISRVDFRYNEKNQKIYILEINTQPGLTDNSLIPEMAKELKINFLQLCEILLDNSICERS